VRSYYTKFGNVIHSWPNVSATRSISRTQRLRYLTPFFIGFGVDGFKRRAKSETGRVDTRKIRESLSTIVCRNVLRDLPFVVRLLITVTCDTLESLTVVEVTSEVSALTLLMISHGVVVFVSLNVLCNISKSNVENRYIRLCEYTSMN
jgi:hypothetical protein